MNDFTNDQETNQIRNKLSEPQNFEMSYDAEAENLGLIEELDDQAILARFDFKQAFKESRSFWSPETTALFCRLARAVHSAGLDWYHVGKNAQVQVRFGRKDPSKRASGTFAYMYSLQTQTNPLSIHIMREVGDVRKTNGLQRLTEEFISQLEVAFKSSRQAISEWKPVTQERQGYWPDELPEDEEISPPDDPSRDFDDIEDDSLLSKSVLNTIYYGPPGTGKTFTTIDAALEIVDPEFLAKYPAVSGSDWKTQCDRRDKLKQRYDALVKEGLIRFVTFHQSFSYEDFVEGLRAVTNDEKQLEYLVEPGVFKRLCDDARTQGVQPELGIGSDPKIWKIAINGTGENPTRAYCFNHGEARIGWGETGDLRATYSPNEYYKNLPSGAQGTLRYFSEKIGEGDILVCIDSAEMIAGVGVVTGDYYYEPSVPDAVDRKTYNHVLPVNWLYRDLQLPIPPLNDGKLFTRKTIYKLDRLTWGDLLAHIEKSGAKPAVPGVVNHTRKPYVLIIDEINRGNTSRIFGELITLIESSKRAGAEEALEVTLPYSKKSFSVPSNVYLIGTMNTADRSLAGLDIALRRRFTFMEMYPNPKLLDDINVSDVNEANAVNIGQMLRKMNERIEVLLDRDHCLGHAYFMPLKNDNSLEKLEFIFRQQILPLLEEYFFEDWERIAWVLNDHKKPDGQKFVQRASSDPRSLFGDDFSGNVQDRRWLINEAAFNNIESYRGILGATA
jgi:5-methylcytosine-specific restriction protein B